MFVCACQFINTAVVALVVNANFHTNLGPLKGQHSDFDRGWYVKVGAALLLVMIINVVTAPLTMALRLAYLKMVRCCCWKKQPNQEMLNALFTNPDFDLAARTAQMMNTIFVCLVSPVLSCSSRSSRT